MAKAHGYGIKLLISIHSYNALEAANDFYGQWYGTGDFYTNAQAKGYFKDRIAHVLAHVNPANGKTWAQSQEYIFAFEAQNEAMHPQVHFLSTSLLPLAYNPLSEIPTPIR
jgi:mannan endo-1,4-beta-mannosidase